MEIILALFLGGLFGFVLYSIGTSNPQLIINMLRLKDLYLMKIILLAIGLSSFLLFLSLALGLVPSSHLRATNADLGALLGGGIFGIGWGMSGFCPGTSLVALATKRKDAIAFVFGGLLGSWLFVLLYNTIKTGPIFKEIFSKPTLASLGLLHGYLPFLLACMLMLIAIVLPLNKK